jgi:hypothetical protein
MKIETPKFVTELSVTKIKDKTWKLNGELVYESALLQNVITVPRDFITDFASVPRLPLAYLLTGNTAHKPAVVHDYLYQTHNTDRKTADMIFNEGMKVVGVSWWRRFIMYQAVRYFGFVAYKSGKDRMDSLNNKG